MRLTHRNFLPQDYAAVGKLMLRSHESLKNDYQASCAELDTLVDLAMAQQGVWGSRAMGAGLGAACIVSLVQADRVEEVKAALSEGYQAKFQSSCEHTASDACAGARRVDMSLYFKEQHGYECIVQANVLKAQGNELFKAGECRKALEKYNRIPLAIKGLIKKQGDGAGDGAGGMGMMGMQNKDEQALTDEERTEVMKLWHTCHINRAMCYIKLENWDKGVAACMLAQPALFSSSFKPKIMTFSTLEQIHQLGRPDPCSVQARRPSMLAVRTTKHFSVVENATVIWASSIRQTLSCLFLFLYLFVFVSIIMCPCVLGSKQRAFDRTQPRTHLRSICPSDTH